MEIQNSKFKIQNFLPSGFTLIELLVVISVIALVSTVGFANFMNLRAQARDQQRKSDLASIASSLQQFRAQYGYYPYFNLASGALCGGSDISADGWARVHWLDSGRTGTNCDPPNPNLAPTFMKKIPQDPTAGNTGPHVYCYAHPGGSVNGPTQYTLFARLENTNDPEATKNKPMPNGNVGSCTNPVGTTTTCKEYTISTGNCADPSAGIYNYWINNP